MAPEAASSRQVTVSPEKSSLGINQKIRSPLPVGGVKQQEKGDQWREVNHDIAKKPEEGSQVVRTRPPVSRKVVPHGIRPNFPERSLLPKKTHGESPSHPNKTRSVPGTRRVWPSVQRERQASATPNPSFIPKDPEVGAFNPVGSNSANPLINPATQGNRQRIINQQPDSGTSTSISEPSRYPGSKQEKKCVNKIKVTHIKLQHKDQRGSGTLTKDGAAPVPQKTLVVSSDSGETSDSSAVSDSDDTLDLFNKLLTDSLSNRKSTTFDPGHANPSGHSADSKDLRKKAYFLTAPPAPASPSTSTNLKGKNTSSSGNTTIHRVLPEYIKQPMAQRSPAKSGSLPSTQPRNRVPYSRVGPTLKSSHHSSPPSNNTSILEVKPSASAPPSDESSSIEERERASNIRLRNGVATTQAHSEHEKKAAPNQTSEIAARGLPLRRRYMGRPLPRVGPFQNQTYQNMRILRGPLRRVSEGSDRLGASSFDSSPIVGHIRRSPLNGGHLKNESFQQPQAQRGESPRNHPGPLVADTTTQTRRFEKQTGRTPTEKVQAEDTLVARRKGHGPDSPGLDSLKRGRDLSVEHSNFKGNVTKMLHLDSDNDNQRQKGEDDKGSGDPARPQQGKFFSHSRQGSSKLLRPSPRLPVAIKYINRTLNANNTKMNYRAKSSFFAREAEVSKEPDPKPHSSNPGVTVAVIRDRTPKEFTPTWDLPEGTRQKSVETRKEIRNDREQRGARIGEARNDPSVTRSNVGNTDEVNRLNQGVSRPTTGDKLFPASSAGSSHFDGLPSQTDYTVSLLGNGPGFLSGLHKLVISTGTSRQQQPFGVATAKVVTSQQLCLFTASSFNVLISTVF